VPCASEIPVAATTNPNRITNFFMKINFVLPQI
jgi:hypothetical protein